MDVVHVEGAADHGPTDATQPLISRKTQPPHDGPSQATSRKIVAAMVLFMMISLMIAIPTAMDNKFPSSAQPPRNTPNDIATYGEQYRSYISPQRMRTNLKNLTAVPHIAGTAPDFNTALFVKAQFEAAGIPIVEIESYNVLLSYPLGKANSSTGAIVSMSAGPHSPANNNCSFTAGLMEAELDSDPISRDPTRAYAYHGYSPAGDVAAPVVYANYGQEADFIALEASGISVNGTVVIVKYGTIFRGNKVYSAQIRGALAVIEFSDPSDMGWTMGPTYPEGPWRAPSGLQRGSVYLGEGDPLTPNYPAVDDALRLTLEEAYDPGVNGTGLGWGLPGIPSIPISAQDALPIMQQLSQSRNGYPAAMFGPSWEGGLGFPYFTGPSTCIVRVKVNNTLQNATIWNVIGTIPGLEEPDRIVMVGNHRDAWVAGAVDPNSGTAALIDIAFGLSSLYASGWRPRRTIVLCSWDAEEFALVGSSEHAEKQIHKLNSRAVAHLNVDSAVDGMGTFWAKAAPAIIGELFRAAKAVPQPDCPQGIPASQYCNNIRPLPGESVYDIWLRLDNITLPLLPGETGPLPVIPEIDPLGSGSDHCAFISHVGITATAVGIIHPIQPYYAEYHSVYDSFEWMDVWGDPSYNYHKMMAQVLGTLALNLASDLVIGFNHTYMARILVQNAQGIATQLAQMNGTVGPPGSRTPDHTLDLDRLNSVIADFAAEATTLITSVQQFKGDMETKRATVGLSEVDVLAIRSLNDRLMYVERAFIMPEGIPGETWYKHVVTSPSLTNSYAGAAYPAVSDALGLGQWRTAQRQLDALCHLIVRATNGMKPVIPY